MISSSEYTELTIEDSSTLLISQFVVTGSGGGGGSTVERRDSFTGNGTTTIFTMMFAPTSLATVKVFLNGRMLRNTDDYSIAGQSVTITCFTPLATDKIDIIYN